MFCLYNLLSSFKIVLFYIAHSPTSKLSLLYWISQTIQAQQRAERDAAIARLEQSRIVLALRLAEHHGNKYKVIEEALAFVGDVRDASCFDKCHGPSFNPANDNMVAQGGKRSNLLSNVLFSSFNIAKKFLKLDHMGAILGNAALYAISMIALFHLHQVANKEHRQKHEDDNIYINRKTVKTSRSEEFSSNDCLSNLDVLLARG